jgi:ribosomal protein S18 acetylase RimI-like enzyme
MLKENLKIELTKNIESNLGSILELYKELYDSSSINGLVICYSPNFLEYLKNTILKSNSHFMFLLYEKEIVIGFAHFIIINKSLFLNNISVKKGFQGNGFGRFLLKKGISYFDGYDLQSFELDVLKSNVSAFTWYKKIGIFVVYETNWVEVVNPEIIRVTDEQISIGFDLNGFEGLYLDTIRIASKMRDAIIVHEIRYLKYLYGIEGKIIISITKMDKLTDLGYELKQLDSSLRMSGRLDRIQIT